MGSTFISYDKLNGFYINEQFMQLTMHYIYTEVVKPQHIFSNKQELIENLEESINGYYHGYLTLYWNYIFNESDKQVMIQVLLNVKLDLQNKGNNISVEELKNISTEDYLLSSLFDKKPFPTTELIRVVDALIEILQGTWNSTDYDMDLNWRYYD